MKLIVTIDAEEDNWNRYSATVNPVENIQLISPLQKLFDEFNVLPTYLVTHPVAINPKSAGILKRIFEEGKCEIGMHCHPWNTPPFDKKAAICPQDTMLNNLPAPLVHQKMSVLHDTISKNFGMVPVSFRAGRWGFGPAVARSLCLLGYRIDSSVTPFVSWEDYQGPDFSEFKPDLFRFNSGGMEEIEAMGPLLEVPLTIGFLQANFGKCERMMKTLKNKLARKLHLPKVLQHLRLLNRVWLSPEMTNADSMIRLAVNMSKNNYPYLNMTFHSTSLLGGASSFVGKGEERNFFDRIRKFLSFCRSAGWESMTLSQFGESISYSNRFYLSN